MKNLLVGSVCSVLTLFSTASFSQEEKSIATELELGAIITSGNTEDENIKYGLTIDWDRGDWDYRFSSDGFRSSRESDLTAQRLYHVANADYTFDAASFIKTRLAYEDDRFSGFESQSDLTINYGRKLLLDRDNMSLALNFGAGVRRSETETDTENVAITRFEGNYEWNLSETAKLLQDFSIDSGSDSNIYRSESAIQTNILDNLSMKFSVKVKHQTDVPINREKTDTQTAITLVLDF
jgi:putative salt-induced outer membrane protein